MRRGIGVTLILLLAELVANAMPPPVTDECRGGEFQFCTTFDNHGVDGRAAHSVTAYLWIPPSAQTLRGVIVTQQNVGEQRFTESPAIRAACAKNSLAIVWCYPAIDIRFEAQRENAARLLEEVLRQLGGESGYAELGQVPWFTFGHSTTATFARVLAETRPARTIAIISAKGGIMLPVTGSIPGVYSGGHFPEWRQQSADWTTYGQSLPNLGRIRRELRARWRPVSYVEEFGGGHFDYTERYLEFLALYIDKAMQYRVNADGAVRAMRDDEGYVVDVRPPRPTAPLTITTLAEAKGELRDAPWFFDRELAAAAVALMDNGDWSRGNQIVAFANLDGTPATFSRSGIVDPVPCEMGDDGVTITRIATTWLDELPENFARAGMKLTHATSGERTIESISGIFVADHGAYYIALNRGYPLTPNFILVRHPGDAMHRPSVQPGRFVPPQYSGRRQRISFPALADRTVGPGLIPLGGTSSAGLKVRFFVREGPAKIVGDRLVLLPLPPRAKLPLKVGVVAWQLGQGGADPVSAAPLVERSFALTAER